MKVWKGYQKGINLGGWFSQCNHTSDRYDNFIQESDIKELSTWGLDHLRLPVDYNLVEDKTGNYIEKGFEYIQKVIDWCGTYGLNLILDLHKTYGYSFDEGEQEAGFFENEKYQERFYCLWEQFAKRFGRYENRLAFELLNEVTDISYKDIWNNIAATCVARIRKYAPDTYILIGGYWNNSVRAVKDIVLPMDEHIIYNFHCYDPLIFTHQGAHWVKELSGDFQFAFDQTYQAYYDKMDELFDENNANKPEISDMNAQFGSEYFYKTFESAIMAAKERNVALYCGEYGVIDQVNPQDVLKWYKAINRVFTEYGIGRAAWTYREMDFGIIGEHYKDVFEELKKYL